MIVINKRSLDMSFFAVESHQERARVVEVRKRDVEQIIATRDRVVADIVLRARASNPPMLIGRKSLHFR